MTSSYIKYIYKDNFQIKIYKLYNLFTLFTAVSIGIGSGNKYSVR